MNQDLTSWNTWRNEYFPMRDKDIDFLISLMKNSSGNNMHVFATMGTRIYAKDNVKNISLLRRDIIRHIKSFCANNGIKKYTISQTVVRSKSKLLETVNP